MANGDFIISQTDAQLQAGNFSREEAEAWLEKCGLEKNVRGETMSLQDFANLANQYT